MQPRTGGSYRVVAGEVTVKSRLESLPAEIVGEIASLLYTRDLLSLRQTCRTIENKAFPGFARCYFNKKQFMLTTESLQCLLDISKHPKLRFVLEHVIFSLDKYDLSRPVDFGHGDINTIRERSSKYRHGAVEQILLLSTGRDCELLTQALGELPNLQTVGIRDHNSRNGWRGHAGGKWHAYGASTVLRETGVDLLQWHPHTPRNDFAGHVFITLLRALGSSKPTAQKLQSLEVIIWNADYVLPDYAFRIPSHLRPTIAPVLENLQTLLLTVDMRVLQPLAPLSIQHASCDNVVHNLSDFLPLLPNLRHVRFNCLDPGGRGLNLPPDSFWKWLGDVQSTDILLPKLERLDLGKMDITSPQSICDIVSRFGKTLKHLNFWKLCIDNPPAGTSSSEDDAIPNLWVETLAKLPRIAPGLECIVVGHLYQAMHHRSRKAISAVHIEGTNIRKYTRVDMRDAVTFRKTLKKELQVHWSNLPDDPNSAGDLTSDSEGDSELG